MKKRFAICSTIVLLLLLSACGAPQALDFSYAPEGEELSSLMVETSQTHRAELEHVPSAADFADAISDDRLGRAAERERGGEPFTRSCRDGDGVEGTGAV